MMDVLPIDSDNVKNLLLTTIDLLTLKLKYFVHFAG